MRRKACALLFVLLGGCTSMPDGPGGGYHGGGGYGGGHGPGAYAGGGGAPPSVPGMQGPWGQNIAMAPPYSAAPPGAMAARAMLASNIPLDMVQMANAAAGMPGAPPGASFPGSVMPAGGILSPPGVPFAPGMPAGGGGVVTANLPPGAAPSGGITQAAMGAVAAIGALSGGPRFSIQRTQVQFRKPANMEVSWYTETPDGKSGYFEKLQTPGRYNFLQAAVYRLKLSKIKDRPLLEVYPTLEVVPTNSRTEAFLAHSAVPVEFTDEDFKQIAEGNYVIKVIYLPDPQYQELAGTGTEEILSTRLEPGADPIQEALRRGSILLVIRMGNIFQELNNTPPMNAPGPRALAAPMPPPPGMPGTMVPYFGPRPPMMGPAGPMMPPGAMVGPGGPLPPGVGAMMPPNSMPPMGPMGPNGFGPMVGPNGMQPPQGSTGPGPMPPNGNFAGPSGSLPGFGPPPGFPGNSAGPGTIAPPGGIRTVPPMVPNMPPGFNPPGFNPPGFNPPGFNPGGSPFPPNAVPGYPGIGGPSSHRSDSASTTQQTGTLPPVDGTAK